MAWRGDRLRRACLPLVLSLLAGCAASASAPAEGTAPRATQASAVGTILAMRPAPPGPRPTLPGLPTDTQPTRESPATEFIIRLDGAGTISVVQPGAVDFRLADRVVILTGPPARVARLDSPD